jgi:hypothetical protein
MAVLADVCIVNKDIGRSTQLAATFSNTKLLLSGLSLKNEVANLKPGLCKILKGVSGLYWLGDGPKPFRSDLVDVSISWSATLPCLDLIF